MIASVLGLQATETDSDSWRGGAREMGETWTGDTER